MLDFASLNQARQGLQHSDNQRHQQSTKLYEQGRGYIREALNGPVNKLKLKQAADCFSKGIQSNYKNPSNYLGLAFLLLLTGQNRQALPLIKTALELDPSSALGCEMLVQAQAAPATKGPSAQSPHIPSVAQPAPLAAGDIDYDALFESTEIAIQDFIRQISRDPVLGQIPAPDPRQLAFIQDKLSQFSVRTQAFHRQLQILDDEFDVNILRQQLNNLDKLLKRLSSLTQLVEQFIEIEQDIRKHTELTVSIIAESKVTQDPGDLEVLEENLQVLLDHCDNVANRLDTLEARQIDIASLHTPYSRYTERLEEFQDVLEETIERLKTHA
jgi:tetratricopeptide (TPR) repeat protein